MTEIDNALRSLKEGHWFKLICGASYQHLPAVRNLSLAYTLAGADCIDVAADPSVIASAQAAIAVASTLMEEARQRGFGSRGKLPWLMVSLNDGEDPHFRKAEFNAVECPSQCDRPCERVCPAQAIVFHPPKDDYSQVVSSGVISESCYGCGRCLPVCPPQIIYTRSYVSTPGAIAPLVLATGVDAVEIHTQVGRTAEFKRLWLSIAPWIERLKLVAISCPDGDGLIEYLHSLYRLISPLKCPIIWQTDGRPMSGDIGDGTTLAAVKLGQKVLAAGLPGYVQLAGGTNSYTVAKLTAMGLLRKSQKSKVKSQNNYDLRLTTDDFLTPDSHISGIAYGSYARVLLSPILHQLEQMEVNPANERAIARLENVPELLWQAVELAYSLVSQLKSMELP
ncbi:4Fe-4S ferredoxin [Chroococcidiopsis sp. CCALA 051]|uniref:circadian clock protein LdpA n=1 Tax=Chroococcidiopsis sp. CCALA 051 TaxID=869949 RepID=UPI000D0D7DE7|nr:LdpA C-terminal domain-containing domain [Chroococcidiopsis sp. CCALA 051]MBE9016597.1 4Fe-4S ferredoxin [Chroococcidiopsidales cyanobacterium LEGE 13417]PSM46524.1 4Fe-4S ferredoxin [Chroococcidiopsis sp. CCALA 051]